MRKRTRWLTVICFIASMFLVQADVSQAGLPEVPTKGMVTMLDIGAKKCIPCKMMAPILEKLKGQYEGKASIVFIDVLEHREQIARFGIRAIPTQIFFDGDGNEVHRHSGFMSEETIVQQLKKMGVDLNKNGESGKTGARHTQN
ncbi:MAG: thioredoxin family protein [Deltaproteobacteria bacterium]|nr:thioredoxin family protein [Deltaproteobacteria bacterium]